MKTIIVVLGLTVYGYVYDGSETLAGVQVTLNEQVTYTNLDGKFILDSVPGDTHTIKLSMVSYPDTMYTLRDSNP